MNSVPPDDAPATPDAPQSAPTNAPDPLAAQPGRSLFARWNNTPLYIRIIGALLLAIPTGLLLGEYFPDRAGDLAIPSKLVLRLLSAIAPPLIFIAVLHALMTTVIEKRSAQRLVGLLLLNTLVAICIGLLVANVIRPGQWSQISPTAEKAVELKSDDPLAPRVLDVLQSHNFKPVPEKPDVLTQFLDNVPKSLLGPLTDDGKVIGVIFLAIALGLALRSQRERPIRTVQDLMEIAFQCLITILHWIIAVIPLAIFGIVASIIGTKGFADFKALGVFVIAVLLALMLQTLYYLIRIRLGSWVRPMHLLRGMRDALVMAFSTASSTATMPLTYSLLRNRVGLREKSASLGSLVGANFNNDGTALYEAMAALFISQMIGVNLTPGQQLMVVLTSVIASVGAAGIPEAGLVTMTLVFSAVGLPIEYIAILLTVDWFLDRCRTVINVLGDTNVSCLLDGRERETDPPDQLAATAAT